MRPRNNAENTKAMWIIVSNTSCVGEYCADILVEDVLVVELKCADHLSDVHTAQCLNYLKASNRSVSLLVNFYRRTVEWKRVVNGFPEA